MTLGEFISETCCFPDADYPFYIWQSDDQKQIWEGYMDEIPEEILEMGFESWEFDCMTMKIGFNVGEI